MGISRILAQDIGAILTWGLRHIAHRPAANLPGKAAMRIDPTFIADERFKIKEGSVAVVGTNGKTSVTNLLADVFTTCGRSIICNRTGSNLAAGVASALLQQKPAQWGVFESDELWLAKTLPQLQADYLVLLNLFRDQLDRCGEISRIQDTIARALEASPGTVLIYNADDPLCASIAARVPNACVAFGVDEDMHLAQNTVVDAQMCQNCEAMVDYAYRQYGQLGDYRCPVCGFARPHLDAAATRVSIDAKGVSFDVSYEGRTVSVHCDQPTPYMVYNLLAVETVAFVTGLDPLLVQKAIDSFDPKNGRLQSYKIDGRHVLLNLAKNPTGFNQNLKIIERDHAPKAVAFFVNDKVADGHDISWIWDIDFEEIARHESTVVFAGGTRANDLQVRLKYAGIPSRIIGDVREMFAQLPDLTEQGVLPADAAVYAIANYTALPPVHDSLDALAAQDGRAYEQADGHRSASGDEGAGAAGSSDDGNADAPSAAAAAGAGAAACADASGGSQKSPVVIAHLFPDLLNLYGDGGNVRILQQRLTWRGIPVEVRAVNHGQSIDLTDADLVFLGGGPDREQKLASEALLSMKEDLRDFVEADGALLAICGGYQILGKRWLWGDELVEGLDIVDLDTRRPGAMTDRLVDNFVLDSPIAEHPIVGYENHAGRTYPGDGVEPLGTVVSSVGHGNNDTDGTDGVRYRSLIGTYSHGPFLSKNPEVADWLLTRALERHARRTGDVFTLSSLDDSVELSANAHMRERLGVR